MKARAHRYIRQTLGTAKVSKSRHSTRQALNSVHLGVRTTAYPASLLHRRLITSVIMSQPSFPSSPLGFEPLPDLEDFTDHSSSLGGYMDETLTFAPSPDSTSTPKSTGNMTANSSENEYPDPDVHDFNFDPEFPEFIPVNADIGQKNHIPTSANLCAMVLEQFSTNKPFPISLKRKASSPLQKLPAKLRRTDQ